MKPQSLQCGRQFSALGVQYDLDLKVAFFAKLKIVKATKSINDMIETLETNGSNAPIARRRQLKRMAGCMGLAMHFFELYQHEPLLVQALICYWDEEAFL